MINKKLFLKQIGLFLAVVAIGTVIDYIVHSTSPKFYVPPEYFRNKIIFATVWGMAGVLVFRHWIKSPTKLALASTALVAVVLQTKYFLQGYDLFFVFLFMFLHFLMFAGPAIVIFRKYPRIFLKPPVSI